MYLGRGVNRATKAWGAALLRKYGTVRAEDFTTQWLGFSTDNVSEREPLPTRRWSTRPSELVRSADRPATGDCASRRAVRTTGVSAADRRVAPRRRQQRRRRRQRR